MIKTKADGNVKIFYRFLLSSALFYPQLINTQHFYVSKVYVATQGTSGLNIYILSKLLGNKFG